MSAAARPAGAGQHGDHAPGEQRQTGDAGGDGMGGSGEWCCGDAGLVPGSRCLLYRIVMVGFYCICIGWCDN